MQLWLLLHFSAAQHHSAYDENGIVAIAIGEEGVRHFENLNAFVRYKIELFF